MQFCGGGGGVCRGPRTTTSFGPQHEHPLARLVIHRQTSAMKQRMERLKVRFEVGHISGFLTPATLAVDNGRAPQYGARHEEAVAREGGRYAPCPPSFGLGTTKP